MFGADAENMADLAYITSTQGTLNESLDLARYDFTTCISYTVAQISYT